MNGMHIWFFFSIEKRKKTLRSIRRNSKFTRSVSHRKNALDFVQNPTIYPVIQNNHNP